jgi:hypothetical protein
MQKDKDPVLDALKTASKGLQFPSETDADFEPFAWADGNTLTQNRLLELAGGEEGTTVEQTSLADLFRVIPSEDRPRFDKLAQALQQLLSGVKVYQVGDEPEKEAYIVGKAPDGRWGGLKTTVVET